MHCCISSYKYKLVVQVIMNTTGNSYIPKHFITGASTLAQYTKLLTLESIL